MRILIITVKPQIFLGLFQKPLPCKIWKKVVNTSFFKIVEVVIKRNLLKDGAKIVFPINQNENVYEMKSEVTFFDYQ